MLFKRGFMCFPLILHLEVRRNVERVILYKLLRPYRFLKPIRSIIVAKNDFQNSTVKFLQ